MRYNYIGVVELHSFEWEYGWQHWRRQWDLTGKDFRIFHFILETNGKAWKNKLCG